MEQTVQPVEIFYSYAEADAPLLEQLERHLSVLRQSGLISPWQRSAIAAGDNWRQERDAHLNSASLILLLISPDFLSSNDIYERELPRALERHNQQSAHVLPILLRFCDWKGAPFASLTVSPHNEKPVTAWPDPDEAWTLVVHDIRTALAGILGDNQAQERPASTALQIMQGQQKSAHGDAFPPIWTVPYRYTPFFTGREQVLKQLFTNFTTVPPSGIIPIQALTGLGGLGKTQTAVAYAFHYRQQYQAVFWIKAETENDLLSGFTTMSNMLGLSHPHRQQRAHLLEDIHSWLSKTTDWLLILDNADNLTLLETFLPKKLPQGHLLLTSRSTAMHGLAQPLPLHPLEPAEGALCLLRRASYIGWNATLDDPSLTASTRSAARDLSQLMDGLPLALEQAGAYIETTGRGVSGYLKLYEKYRPELQKQQYGELLSYRTAVAFTWSIAREHVQHENPAALELLSLCAFLAPEAIPYQIFPHDPTILGPILGPATANELALDGLLAPLRKYSLIKNEVDRDSDLPRLFLHRVLQEVLRDEMNPATQRLWAKRAVRSVALALDTVEWSIMQGHALHCLAFIDQWQLRSREAERIRHYCTINHI